MAAGEELGACVQITIKVDPQGQLRMEVEGVNDPLVAMKLLHAAMGAVMDKLSQDAAAGPPKPKILVPTGFSMAPLPDVPSGKPAAPGVKVR